MVSVIKLLMKKLKIRINLTITLRVTAVKSVKVSEDLDSSTFLYCIKFRRSERPVYAK